MTFGMVSTEAPDTRKPKGWMALGLSVLGVAVIAFVAIWLSSGAEQSTADRDAGVDSVLAERACETAVEAQLKAPSTAEFSNTLAAGNGTKRTVTGAVDAENAFGASIRTSFACEVSVVNEDAKVTAISVG